MLHMKFQDHRLFDSEEILKNFIIYGHGGILVM